MNFDKHFVLELFARTWVRDSHGLYDYESIQTKNLNAFLADNVIIARKKHDIKTIRSVEELKDLEMLLKVKYENYDKYILENPVGVNMQPTEKNITDLSNKLWYVLRSNETNQTNPVQIITNTNDDYYLRKNDIIKLGRVKYALNEIHIAERVNTEEVNDILDPHGYNINKININTPPVFDFIFQAKTTEGEEKNGEVLCKICYSDSNDKENPLVHLCQCSGGIRFAHYQCIKKWMETKLNIKENEKKTVKSYNIKSFNCEICKTPYPFRFKIEGRDDTFDLIDITLPTSNYIVLESLNQMKENCNIKSIHVITLTDDPITIGRGHESDVRINDISVSRSHATLKYDSTTGKLLLKDLKSKFGTLVLLKRPIEIKPSKIHLQIGRTYIEAKLMNIEEFERLKKEKMEKLAREMKENSSKNNVDMDLDVNEKKEDDDDNMKID